MYIHRSPFRICANKYCYYYIPPHKTFKQYMPLQIICMGASSYTVTIHRELLPAELRSAYQTYHIQIRTGDEASNDNE